MISDRRSNQSCLKDFLWRNRSPKCSIYFTRKIDNFLSLTQIVPDSLKRQIVNTLCMYRHLCEQVSSRVLSYLHSLIVVEFVLFDIVGKYECTGEHMSAIFFLSVEFPLNCCSLYICYIYLFCLYPIFSQKEEIR